MNRLATNPPDAMVRIFIYHDSLLKTPAAVISFLMNPPIQAHWCKDTQWARSGWLLSVRQDQFLNFVGSAHKAFSENMLLEQALEEDPFDIAIQICT